jgi:hypothetical protein
MYRKKMKEWNIFFILLLDDGRKTAENKNKERKRKHTDIDRTCNTLYD